MPNARFSKTQRLLKNTEFAALREAAFHVSDAHFLLFAQLNQFNQARLGMVLTKRNIKLAVQRNQIKRITRESFRHQTDLPAIDIILRARPSAAQLTKIELRQCLDKLWPRLAKQVVVAPSC